LHSEVSSVPAVGWQAALIIVVLFSILTGSGTVTRSKA